MRIRSIGHHGWNFMRCFLKRSNLQLVAFSVELVSRLSHCGSVLIFIAVRLDRTTRPASNI